MTAIVKHTIRSNQAAAGTAAPAQPRNSQLRRQFPPRPAREWWPATAQDQDEVLRRLTSPPFLPEVKATRAGRRRGTAKLLRWLSSFPRGHLAAAVGSLRVRGPPGQLMGVAPAGLAARQRPCGLL